MFNSSIISKIEKGLRYIDESERFHFFSFQLALKGTHRDHLVKFDTGQWFCNCERFETHGDCTHTWAAEQLLKRKSGVNLVGNSMDQTPDKFSEASDSPQPGQQLHWQNIQQTMNANEMFYSRSWS